MAKASKPHPQGQKDGVNTTRCNRRPLNNLNNTDAAKAEEKRHGMALTRKLMLCGQTLGTEAIVNFQQIYTVPALQSLGMPLSLTYIVALISAPCSFLILPFLGWLIDKEHNSHRRKFASLVFAAALQIIGVLCLLLGNAMHLSCLLDHNATTNMDSASGGTLNGSGFSVLNKNSTVSGSAQRGRWLASEWSADICATNDSSKVDGHGSTIIPFRAGLGLMGFILMDIGFDCSNSFIKAFVVTCSPRTEQTSLILVGVLVGSVGGVINAILGTVDFTSLLGLSSVKGTKLTIQTSVQGVIIIAIVIAGLLFTVCAGRKQLLELQTNSIETTLKQSCECRNGTRSTEFHNLSTTSNKSKSNAKPDNGQIESSLEESTQNSIPSHGSGINQMYLTETLVEKSPPFWADDTPLLEKDHGLEEEDGDHAMTGYGSAEPLIRRHEESSFVGKSADVLRELRSAGTERSCLSCLKNPKIRILFVCITNLLSTGGAIMYTYAISDFVGKAVYGGDPEAPPGSYSLNSYQEGIQRASWALLVYFVTYLVASFVQPKILALLGFRLEFQLLQLLSSTLMLLTGLTSRMETVFLLSVVAGMFRTCYYTLPFAVINDIAQDITYSSSGKSPVSLAMSLVAASTTVGYCLLCTWVGAFEELTGDVSAPLWLGVSYGILSMITFLFVGKV